MAYRITLIPGDGIGPSVVEVAVKAVEATGLEVEWERVEAGEKVVEKEGTPLPEKVLASIQKNKVALKGPITTPVGSGFRSVNVAIRQALNLYANVRPALSLPGIPGVPYSNIDLIVIRENTEGLYSGVEHWVDSEHSAAESIKIITRRASERIIRFAFQFALKEGRKKVTLVHKANILKYTDGLFLEVGREVSKEFPQVEFEDRLIDNMCMQLVKKPQNYDVIVTTNLYGDIISDLCAGLVGGLGVAPSANIGEKIAVFEPVHGSAPKYAGKDKVNPVATVLSASLMLDYLGEREKGKLIREAVKRVIERGEEVTYDLKENPEDPQAVGTRKMGEAIVREIERLRNA